MEAPYQNREIDEKFKDIKEQLDRIEEQTTLHNGRMSRMEKTMLVVGTAVAVLLIARGSELVPLFMQIL